MAKETKESVEKWLNDLRMADLWRQAADAEKRAKEQAKERDKKGEKPN